MALPAECAAELQGVRGKILKLRSEADAANDRADNLTKQLQEMTEQLNKTEEERNAMQRQSMNLNDQLFMVEGQLKDTLQRLTEVDSSRETLITEVKGLNNRLNIMDDAEERYKLQLVESRDRTALAENDSAELRRNVARYQMENEKLDHDLAMLKGENNMLLQNLKEAEDRLAELTSGYNQVMMENKQLEHQRRNHHHHHHSPPRQQAPAPQIDQGNTKEMERLLQNKSHDLEAAYKELMKRDSTINKLENEINIYQANHRILSDQLREIQQVNLELKQQARGAATAEDQLADAKDQIKSLNSQLTEAENRNSQWEMETDELKRRISHLGQQLQDQKAAYGDLYSQMNKTIKDIQKTTEEQGVCDF